MGERKTEQRPNGGPRPFTTFILGAGATKAWCDSMPLAENFIYDDDLVSRPDLATLLSNYFGILQTVNVEDVASLALSLSGGQPRLTLDFDPRRAYDQVLEVIGERLTLTNELARRLPNDHSAVEFVCQVDKGDVLITLNWDCIVDRAILTTGLYSESQLYQIADQEARLRADGLLDSTPRVPGLFIKLHGSINWQTCINHACPRFEVIKVLTPSDTPIDHDRKGERCLVCDRNLSWYLQDPTVWKDYSKGRLAERMHNAAAAACLRAERIVLFGVSLSPRDYRLSQLLRLAKSTALDGRLAVDIINPHPDPILDQVCSLYGFQASEFRTVEGWVLAEGKRWSGGLGGLDQSDKS